MVTGVLGSPGVGPAAADAGRHPPPRAGAAGLGSAEAHAEAQRVQPRHQEDRQHRPAAGGLQVPVLHAAGPGGLRKQRKAVITEWWFSFVALEHNEVWAWCVFDKYGLFSDATCILFPLSQLTVAC